MVRSSCRVKMPSSSNSSSSNNSGGGGGSGGGVTEHTPRLSMLRQQQKEQGSPADVGDGEEEDAEEDPVRDAAAHGDVRALAAALGGVGAGEARQAAANLTDTDGRAPLHLACRAGCGECVTALLAAGADGTAHSVKGNTPLAVAAKHSQWAAAEALLRGGVCADGLGLLHALRRDADASLASAMVRAGGLEADQAAGGRTALMAAAAAGDARSVKRLLEMGADVAARDAAGATALHHCAGKGDPKCAAVLVDYGSDLEAADQHGNTPLHAAGRCAHAKLYQVLLKAGADPGALNERGRPPKLLDEADGGCVIA